ncbi:MAG TPA: hypothetical protein VFT31_12710 [Kribbella sp.]|nr:hypothetical protein [Kribbella sp.]
MADQPAEEMKDVGAHDDKAVAAAGARKAVTPVDADAPAATGGSNATATATKPKTAATTVATQRSVGPKAAQGKAGPGTGKGMGTMSAVGSGVTRLRSLIASLIWLGAVLAAAVLALGALFTALDQANQSNEIVSWVLDRGHQLVGPFKDLFRLETAKNTLLVNWGIAALVYLVAGKIVERFVRP